MSGDVIGVGLVGYGTSGADLHAPLIGAEARLRLRAVVSGKPDRVHRDLPSVPVVPEATRLLDDPTVELVVVAAPNTVHHELARTALLAGRHVVVDKPFVVTSAEADDLIELAERQGRRLSVFHQRRWDSDFLTVKRCVRRGVLGRVSTYIARYDRFSPDPMAHRWQEQDQRGAGLLYDLGPHLIDQAVSLFGLPETVIADVRAQRPGAVVDDYFHLVLGYGQLRVILHAGSLVRATGPRFEVHGDAGSFVKHGLDGQIAALLAGGRPGDPGWGTEDEDRYGTLTTDAGGLPLAGRLAGVPGAYESFYREMAAAIRGEGPVPVPAEEARDTIKVIECALLSSKDGRAVAVR
ncbi:oxidoreductase [Pseudonocardia bannensis]|uniref:Oxidoreductase n=1 Tax=Pseudonocardia bannensis TaxID=630973 RepID=A0A848DER5_9PSEU|nr:oxidoreductase [Pseudonocardia bannensis]NMH91076.1 oxidoreductase [Pseudonocardia bannensis]